MSILLLAVIWILFMVTLLAGFWLGRSFRPKEDIKEVAQTVTGALPVAKGAVVGLSDEEAAKLEAIAKGGNPDDLEPPNDGIPGYPG